jgi:hypothetical protein
MPGSMYFTLSNITNFMYVEYIREVILSSVQNVVVIFKMSWLVSFLNYFQQLHVYKLLTYSFLGSIAKYLIFSLRYFIFLLLKRLLA